jgi:hypothetical protein
MLHLGVISRNLQGCEVVNLGVKFGNSLKSVISCITFK